VNGGFVVLNASKLLIAIAAITTIALISGCICCCSFDSPLSKFKKSVKDINFPETVTIGGKTYQKDFTHEHMTTDTVKQSIINFASKLGYDTSQLGDAGNLLFSGLGIQEDRSFKYLGNGPKQIIGGSVAKTGAPSTANAGYTAVKQAALAVMPQANDPDVNTGTVQDIVYDGEAAIGDGGDVGRANVGGKICYVTVSRYSNMYITSYSYESAEDAREVAEWVIGQIDEAA